MVTTIHWLEDEYCSEFNDTWTPLISPYKDHLIKAIEEFDDSINSEYILKQLNNLIEEITGFDYKSVDIKEFTENFNIKNDEDGSHLYCNCDIEESYIDSYYGTENDGTDPADVCGPCDQIMFQYDRLDNAIGVDD